MNMDSDRDSISDTTNFVEDETVIKCIFLSKFHATAGSQIAAQVPANFIQKDVFDTISRYIIPKIQLQQCILTLSLLDYKFVGYPVRIDNTSYARNALYFNFCFVFAPNMRTVNFEPVIQKFTEYMLSMELSSKILSQCTEDMAQLARLNKLITQIRTDLNRKQMCMLQEGSTIIPLCIVPRYQEPQVQPFVAAVLNNEFDKFVTPQWDLTTLRILPYINGFNQIDRIAALADVALGLVIDCIKHLVLLGVAILVPVFQYSNVYRPTPKLSQLAKSKNLQEKCIEKCSKVNYPNCGNTATTPKANVRDVFRLFASMAHGATFGELCVRFNPAALNINEKQMVLFGLIEGLIRRVERFPITVQRNLFYDEIQSNTNIQKPSNSVTNNYTNKIPNKMIDTKHFVLNNLGSQPLPRNVRPGKSHAHHHSMRANINGNGIQQKQVALSSGRIQGRLNQNNQNYHFYDGLHSFDEICTTRGISCQQLESQLSKDHHVIVLLR